MNFTRACLSPWQIDLTEIFSTRTQAHTTEENLSRLESFLNAYLLFDRIFVPEKYCTSSFIDSLDPTHAIFVFDSRVSGSHKTTADGQAYFDIDPALTFKNARHLKPKSEGWLKQHIVLDASKQQREELIEYVKEQGKSKPWFHQMILAEYQALLELSMLNDAFSIVFASVSQVYLPDIIEIPRFATFLDQAIRKSGTPTRPSDVVGIFSFELPTGAIEARVRIPPLFDAFIQHAQDEDVTSALVGLRQTYQPLREAFRRVVDALLKRPPGTLVASDLDGAEIREWNEHVEQVFGHADEALLLKSEIVAIEFHAAMDVANINRVLHDRLKAQGSQLRFVPPQSFLRYSRRRGSLSALNIHNVIAFEPKLLRIGKGYRNKRSLLHPGIACVVSFPLSTGAQLTQENLDDPGILAFGEESRPHLYMICTRPRITANPEVSLQYDRVEIEFHFHHGTHTERVRVPFPRCNIRNVLVDETTRTRIVFQDHDGKEASCSASRLYQSAVKSVVAEGNARPPLGDELAGLSEDQIVGVERSDLKVIYVGQSKGRNFDRTALVRLGHHEKWEMFYRHIAEENPHQEIWILLISQATAHHLNMTIPSAHAGLHDEEELVRRTSNPVRIDPSDCINFIEAALISHFKPRYNDKFKKGVFPSKKHESYERLFTAPVDVASIELETWTSIGCRLYSKSVEPRYVHLKTCQINAQFDMGLLFPKA